MKVYDVHIFVCCNQRTGSDRLSCGEVHGHALVGEFKKQIKERKLKMRIRTSRSGCLGICDYGPTVAIYPEGVFYVGVEIDDIREIIESHVIGGLPVKRLLLPEEWMRSQ